MSISPKTVKILWSHAAGRCSYPGCQSRLCTDNSGANTPYTIGEMAHICGEQPGALRHDVNKTSHQRNEYANLILLCPNHHTLIDKPDNESKYTVNVLQRFKSDHETFVNTRLKVKNFGSKHDVATYVYPLLKQNHDAFLSYGPHSEIARRNPASDAHGVWLSERLATIVPNNRKIAQTVAENVALFTPGEQTALTKFLLHARSYEAWVNEEFSYECVVRFPEEFEMLILRLAHDAA